MAGNYRVEIGKSTRKAVKQFPPAEVAVLISRALSLAEEPRPRGCKKLEGKYAGQWRIRVGRYRILYAIDDAQKLVQILKIDLRRDAYDDL